MMMKKKNSAYSHIWFQIMKNWEKKKIFQSIVKKMCKYMWYKKIIIWVFYSDNCVTIQWNVLQNGIKREKLFSWWKRGKNICFNLGYEIFCIGTKIPNGYPHEYNANHSFPLDELYEYWMRAFFMDFHSGRVYIYIECRKSTYIQLVK